MTPAVRAEPCNTAATTIRSPTSAFPTRKDKTGDDRFFILTLIAIAEELTARGVDEKELHHIQLPVGLPPAHFVAPRQKKFTAYFQKKGIVEFQYRDKALRHQH